MPLQAEAVETRIMGRIAEIVGPQRYKVWFKHSTRLSFADGFLKVGVPNSFTGGWIENHFADDIVQAVRDVVGGEPQVSFLTDSSLFRNIRQAQFNQQAEFVERSAEGAARPRRPEDGKLPPSRRLRWRLDQFVVGAPNRLAHSVAASVVENPQADSAPVFVHGSCGLGKTHLLQGIANGLSEQRPQTRWAYLTGEEFTNEFVGALRTRRLDGFRQRYRALDVLLLDDVHFLARKKATQEEFLHTFNTISTAGMRVVLASDVHPKMIGDLADALVNRMMSGMVVRIERPDFDTRCEILRRRAAAMRQTVTEPVIRYVAERIAGNVRELEGCLLKLVAYASLSKTPITETLAKQALEEHLIQTRKILTVSDIELSVATFFGLTPMDLHTSRKSRTVALARNLAMYLARKHTDLSFPEIARVMGNKNHTTVLLAHRRVAQLLEQDADVTWQSAAGLQTCKMRELLERHEAELKR